MKIEKVIFDLGKVLVKFNPRNPFKNILKSEEEINFFLKISAHGNGISIKILFMIQDQLLKKK